MLVPTAQITDAAWRALERGADEATHPMHLLTLATVSPDGRPSARLMINRGCDRRTGRLWFHTDSQTPKVSELRASPFACVVGWDAGSGTQLRAFGSVQLHQRDTLSNRHWEQISAVAQWLWAEPGDVVGEEGEPPDLRLPRDKRQLTHKLTSREREHFLVIELVIETIDWQQASKTETRRATLRAEAGWAAIPV